MAFTLFCVSSIVENKHWDILISDREMLCLNESKSNMNEKRTIQKSGTELLVKCTMHSFAYILGTFIKRGREK